MTPPPRPPVQASGFAFLAVTAFAWGLNWPVMKALMADWPPYTVRIFAAAAAVAVLLGIGLLQGERLLPRRGQWGRLFVFGTLNIGAWSVVAPLSLFWLDAAEAAIIAYTMPVWATVLAWPILGERPTTGRIAGLVLGIAGVTLLMAGTLADRGSAALWAKLPGVAAILGTALMFATGAVLMKRFPVQMPAVPMVAWQIIFGTIPVWFIALGFETLDLGRVTATGWFCLFYLGLIGQCVAYLAWFQALRRLPAGLAATGNLMVPVIGVLSSGVVLGEPLGWRHAVALAMTLGGVAIAARG
jgi:drug/metabolite transporter (DMT)-like permease